MHLLPHPPSTSGSIVREAVSAPGADRASTWQKVAQVRDIDGGSVLNVAPSHEHYARWRAVHRVIQTGSFRTRKVTSLTKDRCARHRRMRFSASRKPSERIAIRRRSTWGLAHIELRWVRQCAPELPNMGPEDVCKAVHCKPVSTAGGAGREAAGAEGGAQSGAGSGTGSQPQQRVPSYRRQS